MRLTPAQKRHLIYILQWENDTKAAANENKPYKITLGRPTHHQNRMTHNALLKRGLIVEANDDFHTITMTDAGRKVANNLVIKQPG